MENDLLFTITTKSEWKSFSSTGKFKPASIAEFGFVKCYHGNQIEQAANEFETEENDLLLIVIDPLRIQVPMKNETINGEVYPNIYGSFSIDAVIDRIELNRSKKGEFSVRVKHFD